MIMAAKGDDELVEKFKKFCELAGQKDTTQMNTKASGKMVNDCLQEKYKKYDIKNMCDASVFPAVMDDKPKKTMKVNSVNVKKFIHKAAHEVAKKKTKNTKLAEDDAEVVTIEADMCTCITGGGPKIKEVKQSATGNVGGLTDASGYTGAHKERFDKDGKGKGIEGRETKVDNSGFVNNFKGAGTYGTKK